MHFINKRLNLMPTTHTHTHTQADQISFTVVFINRLKSRYLTNLHFISHFSLSLCRVQNKHQWERFPPASYSSVQLICFAICILFSLYLLSSEGEKIWKINIWRGKSLCLSVCSPHTCWARVWKCIRTMRDVLQELFTRQSTRSPQAKTAHFSIFLSLAFATSVE